MHKKSYESADNIIDVDRLRRDQRAGICLTFNLQRLKSCLGGVSSSQTAVDILREAEKVYVKRLREDAKRMLIPVCKNTITRLEEVDASLKRSKSWLNNEEGDGEEQAGNNKGRLKRSRNGKSSVLASDEKFFFAKSKQARSSELKFCFESCSLLVAGLCYKTNVIRVLARNWPDLLCKSSL